MHYSPLRVLPVNLSVLHGQKPSLSSEERNKAGLVAAKVKYGGGQRKKKQSTVGSTTLPDKCWSKKGASSPPLRDLSSVGTGDQPPIAPWELAAQSRPSTSSLSIRVLQDATNHSLRSKLIEQISRKRSLLVENKSEPTTETTRLTQSPLPTNPKGLSCSWVIGDKLSQKPRLSQVAVSAWTPFSSAAKITIQEQVRRTLLSVCSVVCLCKQGESKIEDHYDRQKKFVSAFRAALLSKIDQQFRLLLDKLECQQVEHRSTLQRIVAEGKSASAKLRSLSKQLESVGSLPSRVDDQEQGVFDKLQQIKVEVSQIGAWSFQSKDQSIQVIKWDGFHPDSQLDIWIAKFCEALDEIMQFKLENEPVCMVAADLTLTESEDAGNTKDKPKGHSVKSEICNPYLVQKRSENNSAGSSTDKNSTVNVLEADPKSPSSQEESSSG